MEIVSFASIVLIAMPLVRKDLIDRLDRLARPFGVDGVARLDGTLVSIASGRSRRSYPSCMP